VCMCVYVYACTYVHVSIVGICMVIQIKSKPNCLRHIILYLMKSYLNCPFS